MSFFSSLKTNIVKRALGRVFYSNNIFVKRLIPLQNNIRLTQMDVKVENDGTRAVVTLPGFTLHDFDRTGSLNLSSLLRVIKAQEAIVFCEDFFDTQMQFIDELKRPFSVTFIVQFVHGHFPDASVPGATKSNVVDLQSIYEIPYIGNSSYTLRVQIKVKDSCVTLAEYEFLNTFVNLSTRRPEPLPQYMKQKAEKYIPVDRYRKTIVKDDDFKPSGNTRPLLLVEREVKESDVDVNDHANYMFYLEMVADVLGKYTEYVFKTKQREINIENLVMWYKDECALGNIIQARLWEDYSTSDVVIHLVSSSREHRVLNLCRVKLLPVPKSSL